MSVTECLPCSRNTHFIHNYTCNSHNWGEFYYFHFTDEENEVRSQINSPSHRVRDSKSRV